MFFSLFLTNPIERNPNIHSAVVAVFAVGSVLFSILVAMETRAKLGHNPLELIALLSFAGVSLVLFALSGIFRHKHVHVFGFGITATYLLKWLMVNGIAIVPFLVSKDGKFDI